MLKKQRRLLHQFQHIERHNKQNWKNHTSYGKSIDYLAESPILISKMKQIKEHKKSKRNKKKNFLSKGWFKQAADSIFDHYFHVTNNGDMVDVLSRR